MTNNIPRGRFVWHDLMTSDATAAVGFYTKTIGWGTEVWNGGGGGQPYTMWKAGTQAIGGVMPMPAGLEGVPPHWLTYVCTPDTDATCAQAESLGGKVLKAPMDIPTVGRFAVLQDPQGATFATFTPSGDAPGHDGPAALGEFSWHELATSDYMAASRFYMALFGWENTGQFDMGEMGVYLMFGRKGMSLGGMYTLGPGQPPVPNWLPYVRVDNATVAAERAGALGGKVIIPPMDVPGGDQIAVATDPQGGVFAVHEVKKA